jgi:hypothetical protein
VVTGFKALALGGGQKIIIGKIGAEEEERHKGSLTLLSCYVNRYFREGRRGQFFKLIFAPLGKVCAYRKIFKSWRLATVYA